MAFNWLKPLVRACTLIPVIYTFHEIVGGFRPVYGCSMQPTFNSSFSSEQEDSWSDVVLYAKNKTFAKPICRGEVISFWSPFDPSKMLMKRVIAIEGDWIKTRDNKRIFGIPPNYLWVEGDNEEDKEDSNAYGPISISLVDGKVLMKIWPSMSTVETSPISKRLV